MGGQAGGGSGGSGEIDYPTYIKAVHADMLAQTDPDVSGGIDVVNSSVIDAVNSALTVNPYWGKTAYNPSGYLTSARTKMGEYDLALDDFTTWEKTAVSAVGFVDTYVLSDGKISADVSAYADLTVDQMNYEVLPRFEVGMRDINAVQSSQFVVGRAVIEGMRSRDVNKYAGDLSAKWMLVRAEVSHAFIESRLKFQAQKIDSRRMLAATFMEYARLDYLAQTEYYKGTIDLDTLRANWRLDSFQKAANVLAGACGGTVSNEGKLSTLQSALGGMFSGISMGAQFGWGGAGIGGILGLAGGLLGL